MNWAETEYKGTVSRDGYFLEGLNILISVAQDMRNTQVKFMDSA
jgi:hypothetical protein